MISGPALLKLGGLLRPNTVGSLYRSNALSSFTAVPIRIEAGPQGVAFHACASSGCTVGWQCCAVGFGRDL